MVKLKKEIRTSQKMTRRIFEVNAGGKRKEKLSYRNRIFEFGRLD
jgi:hypothetical protein